MSISRQNYTTTYTLYTGLIFGEYYSIINNKHERTAILHYVKDSFTEVFDANNLNLDKQTLIFEPNSSSVSYYDLCRQDANEFPTDPNGGTILTTYSLCDNELCEYLWAQVSLTDGNYVSLYGTDFNSFYVTANGSIVFESDIDPYDITVNGHFSTPRISGLYFWLAPNEGGKISYKKLSDRVAVTFENIPEWNDGSDPNYPDEDLLSSFQVEMFFDGRIRITHLNVNLYWPTTGWPAIVGLSDGDGIPEPFVENDLSDYGSCQ